MKLPIYLATCAVVLAVAGTADARTHRVDQIPYGDRFGCTSCHVSAGGGGVFTPFGSDSMTTLVGDGHVSDRDVVWSELAAIDSDRDGWTNGEELNDPNGTWTFGNPDPIGNRTYNPGDPNDHPLAYCGDGRVTPPEECDGTNFGGRSCRLIGLEDGTLACNSDCTYDRSGCGGGPAPEDNSTTDTPSDEPLDEDPDAACASTAATGAPPATLLAFLGGLFVWRRRRTAR